MSSAEAQQHVRAALLDEANLIRALATGRARGRSPQWRKVELRPISVKAGARLQVTRYTATQAFAANYEWLSPELEAVIDELLAEGFAQWSVELPGERIRMRTNASGGSSLSRRPRETDLESSNSHDRAKPRLLPLDHEVWRALGVTTASGDIKPSRHDKVRQVDEFLRIFDSTVRDLGLLEAGSTVRVIDLGCGNAYLTFAAHAYLESRGVSARVVGVDVKAQSLQHNSTLAQKLGVSESLTFVQAAIDQTPRTIDGCEPDVVVALHACDTASDDALAFGVRCNARALLVAPCCHHDVQRQLKQLSDFPAPYSLLSRDGIVRERWADVLTDALRAQILRLLGYKTDVMEFIESQHTPRNSLIRALRSQSSSTNQDWTDYETLVSQWSIEPKLTTLLAAEIDAARPRR